MRNHFKKIICLLLLATGINHSATAQTAEDSVKAIINKMFIGMKDSDSNLVRSCFADGAFLQTFAKTREGKTFLKTETVSDFAKIVSSIPKGAADEQIVFKDIKIDGPMARQYGHPINYTLTANFIVVV